MLHELAHGYVAYLLGDDTAKLEGRLTLNPLKHLDPFMSLLLPLLLYLAGGPIFGGAKPVPINTRNVKFKEWGFALIALAGPITNFILAFLAFLLGHYTGWLYDAGFLGLLFKELVFVNLGFGIFNLIPIPPLDGSRVIYAIAPDGVRRFMEVLERYGIWIVLILVVICGGFFSQIMTGAINGILTAFYWLVGVR